MYSYDPDNDGDDDTCFNFTTETATTVQNIKYSLSTFTVIANFLAIVVILLRKKYKDFTFRLVIYLMITDILQAVAIILEVLPIVVPDEKSPARVRSGRGWKNFCAASGFIGMITLWMGNIVIFWIMLYLLFLGWRLYKKQAIDRPVKVARIKLETIGVLFLFMAPFVIGFIPFLVDNDMYGMAGLWCWIKQIHQVCGDLHKTPLAVVLTFFYIPLTLIVLFAVICMTITIVVVCCGAVRRHANSVDLQQRLMKEIMTVLAYPVLYCSVCLLLLANRVCLLYTSPSPRDATLSRMPSSA